MRKPWQFGGERASVVETLTNRVIRLVASLRPEHRAELESEVEWEEARIGRELGSEEMLRLQRLLEATRPRG